MRRSLLWVGDAACPSGFARATHGSCDYLDYRANPANPAPWATTVLGINYRGDPTPRWPYDIYTAGAEGDGFGVNRVVWMCDQVKPDAIVILQDPWNIPAYLQQLGRVAEYQHVPVIGMIAVDGENCRGHDLQGLSAAIFWTQFGRDEAARGGWTGPSAVVPLGVDTTVFCPGDRREARQALGLPAALWDAYIVGNVNRNQPRKRLDLTIRYFALWHRSIKSPANVYLYLHVAPTGEHGYNVRQLAAYYGVLPQVVLMEPAPWYGEPEARLVHTYRAFDVQVTTTQGEGDGLTTKEGMACGIPQIVPAWSALGEWTKGAALQVPCTSTAATIGRRANAIGGIADEALFVERLTQVHAHRALRVSVAEKCLACAQQPAFVWDTVGRGVAAAIEAAVAPAVAPVGEPEGVGV